MSDDEKAIRSLLQKRLEATRSKNAEVAVEFYSDDVVVFDIAPPLAQRGAEARDPAGNRAWFETWDGPLGIDLHDVTVRVVGNMALAYGFLHLHGNRTDGTHTEAWVRSTVCLEKRGGRWTIIHEHGSFPMKMDGTGKVADDLKP